MKKFFLILVFSWLFLTAPSRAQHYLLQDIPTQTTDVQLRFMHPSADNYRETTSFSGVYELRTSIPVSSSTNIVASLPYLSREYENTIVTYYYTGPYTDEVQSGVANLFLGARFYTQPDDGHQTIGTIGVYLPTISENSANASGVGYQADYHNIHKYLRKTTTIYGNIMSHWTIANGAHYELEIGPRIMFMDSGDESDTEFMLHYGLGGSVPVSVLALRMELAGLFFLSSEADEFSDKFNHTLAFGARYDRGPFTPGFFYQIYLSDMMSDTVNGVLGIDFIYRFGGE